MPSKTEAYVALVSLMNTLHMILYPPRHWIRFDEKQMECLLEKVGSLIDFLEDEGIKEIDDLESQMTRAAYAAEDIVESYVLDINLARSTGSVPKSSTCFALHVQKLIEEMDRILAEAMKKKEAMKSLEGQPSLNSLPVVSSRLATTSNSQNTPVGLDEKVNDLVDKLTGPQPRRQIIAIAGMGGIGKTTLARQVFDNPYVVYEFHLRAWVTISQEYSARKIILDLLSDIEGLGSQGKQMRDKNLAAFTEKMSKLRDDELGEHLHKRLSGRTYLIVMDDMWSTDAWDGIRAFFPDNCNGSRIVVTSRLSGVAEHLSSIIPYKMEFLDHFQSWKLLCENVFGKEGYPPDLEDLGRTIAKYCRGLPLSIVVIGGVLAKSNMTPDFWEHVAENLNSIINSMDDEYCLKILSLSYNNLPLHLKPCLLHMVCITKSRYCEERELIELWVSEGFVKPIRGKTLEEVAQEYLMELVARNLVLLRTGGLFGIIKLFGIHDIIWELCMREAQKKNFICPLDVCAVDNPQDMECKRRLCFNQQSLEELVRFSNHVADVLKRGSLIRSAYFGSFRAGLHGSNLRMLRVFDMIHELSSEITQLRNLRYVVYIIENQTLGMRVTSWISLLWNLQILDLETGIEEPVFLPLEIWEMPQIRHLRVQASFLPDPPCSVIRMRHFYILENLQTLAGIINFRFTEEVIKRIPNLKLLSVFYRRPYKRLKWFDFCLYNLVHFHILESLTFFVRHKISANDLGFPFSIKKLYLGGCHLPWEDMTKLGSLPNLELLGLYAYAFEGIEWCPVEGEFVRLKYLKIDETDLLYWRADKSHFPILEHIIFIKINLEEFPLDIGTLPTLRIIELENCNDSTIASAKEIREERENMGNDDLQLVIRDV